MKASLCGAVAFGWMLALVVGLRLSHEGLLFVASALLGAMLLAPLLALAWFGAAGGALPEVWVERPPAGDLGSAAATRPVLALSAPARERRGGWPHLGLMMSDGWVPYLPTPPPPMRNEKG